MYYSSDSDSDSASLQSVSSAENARSLELTASSANVNDIMFINSQLQSIVRVVPLFDKECRVRSEWTTLWSNLEEDVMPLSPTQRRYTDLASIVRPLNQCNLPVTQ